MLRLNKVFCRRGLSLLMALAMCAGLLQMPAFAAEEERQPTYCGLEEHTHDDACAAGELPCDREEHQHTDGCYSRNGMEPELDAAPLQSEPSVQDAQMNAPAAHVDVSAMTPKQKVDRIIELMELVPNQITKENMNEFGPLLDECDQIMGGEYCENFGDAEWDYADYEVGYAFYDAMDKFGDTFKQYQELLAEQGNDGKTLIESKNKEIQLTYEDGVLTIRGKGRFTGLLVNKTPYYSVADLNRERPELRITRLIVEGESEADPIVLESSGASSDKMFGGAGLETLTAGNARIEDKALENAFADGANITLTNCDLRSIAFENSGNLGQVILDHVMFGDNLGRCHTFSGSSIEKLVIQNMERIPAYVFSNCTVKGEVDLGGIEYVGEHAFSGTGTPVLKNLSEDAVVGYSDVFVSQLDGWGDRVAAILKDQFAMDPQQTAEPLGVQGWTSNKVGKQNSTEGLVSTQITQEARWSNNESTEAEVLAQAYFTDVQQMDFIFVMDLSNSMSSTGGSGKYSRFNEMQSKLMDVSGKLLTSGDGYDCQVAYVSFGGDSDPWYPVPWEGPVVTKGSVESSDFTKNVADAVRFITDAEVFDEYTDYGLGLGKALELAQANQEKGRQTAVILVSDGEPNKGDGKSEAEQIRALGVPIFGVLQSVPEKQKENAKAAMENICTTGLFFEGEDTDGFSKAVNDAVHSALKTCSFTVKVNPKFELDKESVIPSAGTVDISADGTLITWTIIGKTFAKHTLNYKLKLNPEENGYPYGTFDTNDGNAELLTSGLRVNEVETPQLTRTRPQVTYTLRYDANRGSGAPASQTYTGTESTGHTFTVSGGSPTRSGYTFLGWSTSSSAASASYRAGSSFTLSAPGTATLYAVWSYNSPPIVDNNDDDDDDDDDGPTRGGGGGGGTTINDGEVPLAGDLQLNREDHFAYIKGYQDGTVRPQNPLTRAQVATIFYRLLDEMSRTIYFQETNDFSDVADSFWANKAISTLTNAGIITGFQDGTFRPNAYITRAQFAAIAARFDSVVPGLENPFSDVAEDYWARDLIAYAASKGWIKGESGRFRPLENITRVEAMDFINNVLERHVDREGLLEGATTFSDVPVTDPNYYVVEEATNTHDYDRRTKGELMENWTALKEDPVWDE